MSATATTSESPETTPEQNPSSPADTSPADSHRRSFGRFPLVPVALAVSIGIVTDRFLQLAPAIHVAFSVGSCFGLLSGLRIRSRHLAALSALVLCGAAGALHHHLIWWSTPEDDIGRQLRARPTLMKISGRVADRPAILLPVESRRSAIPQTDVTWLTLACEQIVTPDSRLEVSGQIRVSIAGRLADVRQGDQITVLGEAAGLPTQQNPGEARIADSLRRQHLRGIIRVKRPELIQVVSRSNNPFTAAASWLRSRCETSLQNCLTGTSQSIASALLIGDRSLISRDVRASFVESGTMHLLAISGLHIGILTGFIFACCRLCGWSDRQSVGFVLALLAIYLAVADLRPPVIRACVLVSIWSIGKLLRRPSFSANSLAGAAIVVLALNPTDLFDVGAQLSFLAVAAILWLIAVRNTSGSPDIAAESDGAEILLPMWRQLLRPIWRWLAAGYLTTGTIWLLTMPLVASAFNVVPVVGLLVNVLLIPLVGAALCVGFVSLVLGVIHPVLAVPAGYLFDALLNVLLSAVQAASSFEYGHFYVPSPPQWWLLGIYSLIAAAMLWMVWRRGSPWLWATAVLWTLFGISVAMQPERQPGLRCTFLSVGHGLSVLIETPSGKTLLYDAGSLADSRKATRAVEQALWERGRRRIDTVVISHADVDHYNGVADLFHTFRIGDLRFSPQFLDETQPGTIEIRDLAKEHGTQVDEISTGDELHLDPQVTIRVLQPEAGARYSSDNAGSIVLEIAYGNRRILLTGDLEHEGLFQLMDGPGRKADILLSPHHGSLAANPRTLAEWCDPIWIVASSGNRFPGQRLRTQYGEFGSRVLSTFESGAIEFHISPQGEMQKQHWGEASRTSESSR